MAWVDESYIDRVLRDSGLRQRLWSVDGSYAPESLAQAELAARGTVVSYLQYAGYADPGETIDTTTITGAFLADLVASLMISQAFGARGIKWPAGLQDAVTASLDRLEAMRDRRLPVPGMTPSITGGIGGFSITSPKTHPQRFSRSQLRGW